MPMTGFFATIFHKDTLHDGTRRAVMENVGVAREEVERAGDRLERVIRGLLDENDRVTGRQQRNGIPKNK